MPQIDQINTFAGQIFWLFVCFGLLYFFMARFVVPKLSAIIGGREEKISSDTGNAEKYKNEALELGRKFEELSLISRNKAMNIVAEANKEANLFYDKGISSTESDLLKYIESAEKDINLLKDKAFSELSKHTSAFVEQIVEKITGGKVNKNLTEKLVSKINS